jgi:GMP synthase-like glutamine amidotransferase
MRLGLLICDHVSPELRDVSGDYPDMFRRLLAGHPGVELASYELTAGEFPASPDDCDAWITTGSRHSVYDEIGWIEAFADLVRAIDASRRPYVGVCFGHQMLAHALGGKVELAEQGWGVGVNVVEVPDPPAWLGVTGYSIINSHADQVTGLPRNAVVIGGNDHCPVSLMTVGDHMLGIQGHPEFTADYAAALLQARRGRLIPAATADAALETLGDAPDLLADAIVRFLDRGSSVD